MASLDDTHLRAVLAAPTGPRPGARSRPPWALAFIALAVAIAAFAATVTWFAQRDSGAPSVAATGLPLSVAPPAPGPTPVVSAATTTSVPTTAGIVAPVVPIGAEASSTSGNSTDGWKQTVTFQPANAIDGRMDTAWRPVEGDGVGQTLTLSLGGPRTLTSVGLVPGYAKVDSKDGTNRFFQERRIERARWVFDDGTSVEQSFTDTASMQSMSVSTTTAAVRIEILSTRPPLTEVEPRNYAPISEVAIVAAS